MANVQHSTLPEAQLHEPKGVSTAAVDTVYVANGAGSGVWQKIEEDQLSALPEPKGIAAAAVDTVYVANGAGSGVWQKVEEAQLDNSPVNAGSILAVTAALHAGRVIMLNATAGSVCTLPVATGSGNIYKFAVSVLATSNSHIIKVADSNGSIRGVVHSIDQATAYTVNSWGSTPTSDTITLNRSTTGSVYVGEMFTLTDIATNIYSVTGWFAVASNPATPFSSSV